VLRPYTSGARAKRVEELMAKSRLEIGTTEKGKPLLLPAVEATTQTIVVYGGKGMGKTNLGAVLCEELAAAGRRFCFIDPVGVAWGLRHSADGQGEGIKLLILGGRHGDLPIEPTGGAVVADFIAESSENVLIDISSRADGQRWSVPDKIRFVTAYVRRLLERHRRDAPPLMLIIDEAARFAPQQISKSQTAVADCLAALEVLVEEGRNSGIGVTLLTQRSARMAKSVSELAEAMISFRIIGPNSVDAVLDWFGEHVHKSKWDELVEQLRKLPRGQALIVSPGWLEFEGVASIRLRSTFDSSKTPTGTEKKLARRARPADLDKLREQIAATVEKAEAEDPLKLRSKLTSTAEQMRIQEREIGRLKLELETERAKPRAHKTDDAKAAKVGELKAELVNYRRALEAAMKILVKVKAIDFDVDTEDGRKALEQALAAAVKQVTGQLEKRVAMLVGRVEGFKLAAKHAEEEIGKLLAEKIDLTVQVQKREPYAVTTPATPRAPRPASPRAVPVPDGPWSADDRLVTPAGSLKKHIRGILIALAQHPDGRTREQALILAGYSPSGDISTGFAGLLEHRLIEDRGGVLAITGAGLEVLGPFDPLPIGAELRAHLLNGNRLSSAERKLLGALFSTWPNTAKRAELHELAGLKPSGDTSTAIAKFLKLGWAVERDGGIVAAETFFPEGV